MTAHGESQLELEIAAAVAATSLRNVGIAVSGGGDSMALLHLLAATPNIDTLYVATVDHGLRAEARAEAHWVADRCQELGLEHTILTMDPIKDRGNLQDAARRGRYNLLLNWAQARGLDGIALGHTQDDVAETFLMRLARKAGIDGLAAMPVERQIRDVTLWRPLLGQSRQQLRDYLRTRNLEWIDDPSNEDSTFDRIKIRQILPQLADVGIDQSSLAATAGMIAQSRALLTDLTARAAQNCTRLDGRDIIFSRKFFDQEPQEIKRRLLISALKWVAGSEYPPRGNSIQTLQKALEDHQDMTLNGCMVLVRKDEYLITREYQAISQVTVNASEIWDNFWSFEGADLDRFHIGALGEAGLAQVPNWRETGRPRSALLASAALWDGKKLISAPMAGYGCEYTLKTAQDFSDYISSIISR